MNHTLSIEAIAEGCINCGICVTECAFLQEYGSPLELATRWSLGGMERIASIPFECSLCGLCRGVCPKDLDPTAMFLAMRQELVLGGRGIFKQHKAIRSYEKRGSSSLFSWFSFPPDCQTILFPGCAFSGSRPQTLFRLFQHLQKTIPDLGIVFDCCTKPSHDLGDIDHFTKMFGELKMIFAANSIKKVLLACPNCYRVFKEYGVGLEVQTVYEYLSKTENPRKQIHKEFTVHDPCGVRFAGEVQQSIRALLAQLGVTAGEMKHTGRNSFCCGEGGAAGYLRPDLAKAWMKKRVKEARCEIVSYCAGCTNLLGRSVPTHHILDLYFFPDAVLNGKQKVSKTPLTYWNRYRLKQRLKKEMRSGICGSRNQLCVRT